LILSPAPAAFYRAHLCGSGVRCRMDEPDYYQLLGVSPNATLHEIRTTFRQKVLAEHPDKGGDPKRFQLLNKAYMVLTDQEKRKRYDMTGRTERTVEEEFADSFGGGRLRAHERPKEADEKAVVFQDQRIVGEPSSHEDGFAEWLRQRDQSEMVMTDKDFMKTALFNAAELAVKIRHQGPVQHVLGGSKVVGTQVQVKAKSVKKALDHDEILVRMLAVPVDSQMVNADVSAGTCLGTTGIGRVEQVGSRCERLRPDEAVLVLPKPTKFTAQKPIGTARTLLVCQEEDLLPIPAEIVEELTPEQLCMIPALVTAYILLEQYTLKLQPGDSILLNGAHLSDGGPMLQLCRLLKLKPLVLLDIPGAPSVSAKGEYASTTVWQDTELAPMSKAVKEQYDLIVERLQTLGAEEIFPNAVDLLKWRDRNQRIRPKIGLDGLAAGQSAEQLIHCLASGDKEGSLVIYGSGGSAPLDLLPTLVAEWGGSIVGFNIARWVHEPGNTDEMMTKIGLLTKLVRANKFSLDSILFKVGEDDILDAFKKQTDITDTTQVVLIFPTLQEEERSGAGASFKPEPREAVAEKAAKQRKEDEDRIKLQDEWLRLLFTSRSVAASEPEGELPVAASGGNQSNPIALVVWIGDSPQSDTKLLKEVMTSFPNTAYMATAWSGHKAGDDLSDIDLNSSEVKDGSFYLRGRGAFENKDLDNLHVIEVLGRCLIAAIQAKLSELGLEWKNVVLCGFGKGAGIALYASVLKLFPSDVAGLILFSPVTLFPSFLGEKIQTRPMLGKMSKSMLYMVWGKRNLSTPSQYKQLLAQSLSKAAEVNCITDELPEGDHKFSPTASKMLEEILPKCLPR